VFANIIAYKFVKFRIKIIFKSLYLYTKVISVVNNSLVLGKLRTSQCVRYWCKVSGANVTCDVVGNCKVSGVKVSCGVVGNCKVSGVKVTCGVVVKCKVRVLR
jgi:hypothetical protein